MAVEHGRRRGGAARHAEQDRRDRIAGRRGRAEAEQQRERRIRVHREGEGQQHRGAGEAADPRNDAEHQAHDAAEREEHQAVRLHQQHEGLAGRGSHEGSSSAKPSISPRLPEMSLACELTRLQCVPGRVRLDRRQRTQTMTDGRARQVLALRSSSPWSPRPARAPLPLFSVVGLM